MQENWQPHSTGCEQQIALVKGVDKFWSECPVDLKASVIRFWERKKNAWD
jgi:hypothetical protein